MSSTFQKTDAFLFIDDLIRNIVSVSRKRKKKWRNVTFHTRLISRRRRADEDKLVDMWKTSRLNIRIWEDRKCHEYDGTEKYLSRWSGIVTSVTFERGIYERLTDDITTDDFNVSLQDIWDFVIGRELLLQYLSRHKTRALTMWSSSILKKNKIFTGYNDKMSVIPIRNLESIETSSIHQDISIRLYNECVSLILSSLYSRRRDRWATSANSSSRFDEWNLTWVRHTLQQFFNISLYVLRHSRSLRDRNSSFAREYISRNITRIRRACRTWCWHWYCDTLCHVERRLFRGNTCFFPSQWRQSSSL